MENKTLHQKVAGYFHSACAGLSSVARDLAEIFKEDKPDRVVFVGGAIPIQYLGYDLNKDGKLDKIVQCECLMGPPGIGGMVTLPRVYLPKDKEFAELEMLFTNNAA